VKFLPLLFCLSVSAQSFIACGGSALPSSSPKPTGWCASVSSTKVSKLWNIAGIDFTVVRTGSPRYAVQTVGWDAAATPLQTYGKLETYGLMGIGGATTGANQGYVVTGGVIGRYPLKLGWIVGGWMMEKTSIGGTQALIKIGWGK